MARKLSPQTKKIQAYLRQGMSPTDIADKLKLQKYQVYNAQYALRKKRSNVGIKSIAPRSETGIASLIPKPTLTPTPPKTLWQRVVNFFKGSNHA